MRPAGPTRRAALAALPLLGSCALWRVEPPPPVPREFRGAWIASVAHIDWPSRRGLDTAAQRAELQRTVAQAAGLGLNALLLQVRPSADALYRSALEPWSEFLTGASGRAPDDDWDPLAEWVAAAHAAGLELHAWFNPYRAWHPSARGEPAATHVARARPELVRRHGDLLWLDPAEPAAAAHTRAVVRDVLQRYDVDGVHIDDYFYPYPLEGQDFADDGPWQRYRAGGGTLARADWRREQVDRLVQDLHADVHAVRPHARFTISPFGLPRPDRRPPGIEGFSQYDRLYAHVERWLAEGWLDALVPQLYWPIARPAQAFGVLQRAWRELNPHGRPVWPGLFTSRIGAERNAYDSAEVLAQVALTRGPWSDQGHVHFSWAALRDDRDGVATRLREGPYAEPALPPAMPWLAEPALAPLRARWMRRDDGRALLWPLAAEHGAPARQAVLWQHVQGRWGWAARPLPAAQPFELHPQARALALVAVGRTGLESPAAWLHRPAD